MWCLIESEPVVFWELLERLGCADAQVEELWSLEEGMLEALAAEHGSLHGLVFLYKFDQKVYEGDRAPAEVPPDMFFARQMIENSCATQALLSIVLNAPQLELGDDLRNFKSFCTGMSAEDCGYALASHTTFREAHNSFAAKVYLQQTEDPTTEHEEPFHFVAFVPHQPTKTTWLLDGLRPAPVLLGSYEDKWYLPALTEVQRIVSTLDKNIKFNMMAIVPSRRKHGERELAALREQLQNQLRAEPPDPGAVQHTLHGINTLKLQLASISDTEAGWRRQNSVRTTSMAPVYLSALRRLGQHGLLARTYAQLFPQ